MDTVTVFLKADTLALLHGMDGMQLIIERPSMTKRLYKFFSSLDPITISLSITTIAFCGFLWKSVKWEPYISKADKNVQTDQEKTAENESEDEAKQVIAID